jgi:O-antigen/teichoic acid export membrane protein
MGLVVRMTPFDPATARGRSQERLRRASLSAIVAAAAKGVALVTTAVSVPLTLEYLGSERFGIWMTLSALIALLGFTDLGLGNSMLNRVADAAGRDDRRQIQISVSSGIAMLLAVAVGFGLLFAISYEHIPWERLFNVRSANTLSEVGPAAAVLAACFLVAMPCGAVQQVRLGLQQGYVNAMFVGAGNLAGLVLVILAIQAHLGLPWLVAAMAGGPVLATVVNGVALLWVSPWLMPRLRDVHAAAARGLLRVGMFFLVLQVAVAVAFTSNSLILAAMLGPSAVAEYAVASRVFLIPALLVGFALSPLWPAYREALSRGDVEWVRQTFNRSIKLAIAVGGIGSGVLVVVAIQAMMIWVGTAVTPSFDLVLALGIWTTLSIVGAAVATLLNAAQVMRFQVVTAVLMATANVGLSVALTTRLGIAGVVWGSIVAYTLLSLVPVIAYLPRLFARLDLQPESSGGLR